MRKFYSLLVLAGVGVAGCTDSSGPARSPSTPQFSRQITFPDLKQKLESLPATGAARAEITLRDTGRVAREVNLEDRREMEDRESVRGRITALAGGAAAGTLTLAPGFQVTFTASTRFETEGDTSLTAQQFIDRVQAALAQNPAVFLGVRAERSAMNPLALGPGDAFPADKIELKPGVARAKLKINVTPANLVAAGDGDCTMAAFGVTPTGCLKVLGVTVGIVPETELKAMNPGVVKAEFEGFVDCSKTINTMLDPDGSFFLKSGAQVLVDAQTEVEREDGGSGDAEHLTLAAVAVACGATPAPDIDVEGEGVLVSASGESPVIRATEVKFEREEDEEIEAEFSGTIDAISGDTVTVSGRAVLVDGNTRIERDGDGGDHLALSDLHVGQSVEVKAVVSASGMLVAREIKVGS